MVKSHGTGYKVLEIILKTNCFMLFSNSYQESILANPQSYILKALNTFVREL
jgi:hypothetical protein